MRVSDCVCVCVCVYRCPFLRLGACMYVYMRVGFYVCVVIEMYVGLYAISEYVNILMCVYLSCFQLLFCL